MKIKTADLIGPPLDWAVAKCSSPEELEWFWDDYAAREYKPSTEGDTALEIMEREGGFQLKNWLESKPDSKFEAHLHNHEGNWVEFGPTLRIAVCRCYVASKLGDEVEVPEELIP